MYTSTFASHGAMPMPLACDAAATSTSTMEIQLAAGHGPPPAAEWPPPPGLPASGFSSPVVPWWWWSVEISSTSPLLRKARDFFFLLSSCFVSSSCSLAIFNLTSHSQSHKDPNQSSPYPSPTRRHCRSPFLQQRAARDQSIKQLKSQSWGKKNCIW